jgi:hypothetical protein
MDYSNLTDLIRTACKLVNPNVQFFHGRTFEFQLADKVDDVVVILNPATVSYTQNNLEMYACNLIIGTQDSRTEISEDERVALIDKCKDFGTKLRTELFSIDGGRIDKASYRMQPLIFRYSPPLTGMNATFNLYATVDQC